ncbi:hypothetical protein A3K73_08110 [Candidatus Pacearchaeota archaeon RBG_13_36_9]|nr:MAG: hypothetical protein A3K73_08110 [Candidatus Pacearchaeota archaeon RBG_13_36_9]
MKVLHLIDSLNPGGAQTVVKGIFEKQKNNKDIFLFALRKRDIKTEIDHPNVFIFNSSRKYSLKPLKDLKQLIEKEKIDILHCHLFRSQFTGYLLKKRYFPNIKLIFHEHGEIFQNHLIYNIFMNKSPKRVNLFIAVSKATKNELIKKAKINPQKIVVLYNFVDTDKFNRKNITWNTQKEKEKLGIQKDEYVIGFVGRLAYVKGCDILIKALPHLDFKYKVLIAGDGPERKKLERLADKLGVRDKVIFLGYVDNPLWVYSLMDVLVVPSRSESFGISIIEAQSFDIPVVSSDVKGLNEIIIDKENGTLFEGKDSKDLAKKIETIYSNKDLRKKLIKEGYKNIKRFFWGRCMGEMSKVYKEVIKE